VYYDVCSKDGINQMNASDENLPGQWIGRMGAVEFPPHSPNLTTLDFFLRGTLKDVMYRKTWLH